MYSDIGKYVLNCPLKSHEALAKLVRGVSGLSLELPLMVHSKGAFTEALAQRVLLSQCRPMSTVPAENSHLKSALKRALNSATNAASKNGALISSVVRSQNVSPIRQLIIRSYASKPFGLDYNATPDAINHIKDQEFMTFDTDEAAIAFLEKCEKMAQRQKMEEPYQHHCSGLDTSRMNACVPNLYDSDRVAPPFEYLVVPAHVEEHFSPACTYDKRIDTAIAFSKGVRPTMEDAHVVTQFVLKLVDQEYPVILTAVLDGHGGDECAEFASENLQSVIEESLVENNADGLTVKGIVNGLANAAVELSHRYNSRDLPLGEFNLGAGSTLNGSLEIDGNIYFINVGDSRAVFVEDSGEVRQLTADHKLSEAETLKKIEDRGGNVWPVMGILRIDGRLSVAAALGDHWANGAVSATPRITRYTKAELEDGVIIHACDGIFEVATTDQLGRRVLSQLEAARSIDEIAKDTVMAASESGSGDNMSVVIRRVGGS